MSNANGQILSPLARECVMTGEANELEDRITVNIRRLMEAE